jgi:hypothetical protein
LEPVSSISAAQKITLRPEIEILKHGLFGQGISGWEKSDDRYTLRTGLDVSISNKRLPIAFSLLMEELGISGSTIENPLEKKIRDINRGRTLLAVTIPAAEFEANIKPKLKEKDGGDLSTNVREFKTR